MFIIAVICVSLALVHSQSPTHPGHTHHPHASHTPHPHSHQTHTQHPHTTPVPITDHTFSAANPLWFMDTTNHVMVMKTDSGCYGQHLTPEQVTLTQTADGLLKLERGLLSHIEHAKMFTNFHPKGKLSHEIQKACPTIIRPMHPEH